MTRFGNLDPREAGIRSGRRRRGIVDPLAGTVLDLMALYGDRFAGDSWAPWRAFLKLLHGLPRTAAEEALARELTGRTTLEALTAPTEAWLICGRRAGKSQIAALEAVHAAAFRDYRNVLAPGERGVVMVLAADRQQARVVFGYVVGLLEAAPPLAALVAAKRRESVDLKTGVSIEIHTASYKTTRGYTLVAAVLDEVAFWATESGANPDAEILAAIRPGLATIPGARLLALTTPYARRGEAWRAFTGHYGKDADPVCVWRAATRTMNPQVPEAVVARAYADDATAAEAEFGAQFRRDVESFLDAEAVGAVVVPGRRELPPRPGVEYVAAVDPSGGSADAFTMAIAHREGERVVLDVVRERRPPFSPDAVVAEFTAVFSEYAVHKVTGDRYGGEWPRERFATRGVRYVPAERNRSEAYLALLPLVNSGRVELLDVPTLTAQLVALERRTARGGRETVDHPPFGHDDVANAAALAVTEAAGRGARIVPAVSPPLMPGGPMYGAGSMPRGTFWQEGDTGPGWFERELRREGYDGTYNPDGSVTDF